MRKFLAALGFVASLVFTLTCYSQASTGVPFLLISPMTDANGMGGAAVGASTYDPLAVMVNPAHLGAQSRTTYYSTGYNYSAWLPQFQLSDLWLRTYAVTVGMNLKEVNENAPPLSVGAGYSRVYLNLGDYILTSQTGPEEIGRYRSSETSDQYSIGMCLDYWIRASAGVTYKHVASKISGNFAETGKSVREGKANLYDYGFLFEVPLMEIVSKMTNNFLRVTPNLSPFLDASIGVSRSNLGQDSITYPYEAQGDPLPRYARAGVGVELGALYTRDALRWKPYSFKWTRESADVLVGADRHYTNGLGHIQFFNDVIIGRTNNEIEMKNGWEFNVLEVLAIRGGRFEEAPDRGNRRFTTSGWGVQLAGLAKFLRAADARIDDASIAGFILGHIDVRYDHSEWYTDDHKSPLKGTNFDAVTISLRN